MNGTSVPTTPLRADATSPAEHRTGSIAQYLLAGYALLLLGVPQSYAVAGIGFSLTPARLVAGAGLLYWFLCRVGGRALNTSANPVRWVLFVAVTVWTIAAAIALARPLGYDVLAAVDRTVLLLVLSVGVAALACDGLGGIRPIRVVAAAAVVGGTISAVTALTAFFTGVDLLPLVQLPGLEPGDPVVTDLERSGLERALGTAGHPIELAATCIALVPLAIHLARYGRARILWAGCVLLLVAGALTTISRTGLLGLGVLAVLLLPVLGPGRWLLGAATAGVLALVSVSIVPQLADALLETVLGSGQDSSVLSRLDDYSYALARIAEHPLAGQGLGTYQVPQQPYLDNQYLLTTIESGLPGLAALLLLLTVPACLMLARRQWTYDGLETRSLAWSIGAGLAVCAASFATYDALTFAQIQGVTFLLIGLAGAVWATRNPGSQ